MSRFKICRSLLAFATCLTPAFVIASPLAAPAVREEGLIRRGNPSHIHCGNAPNIVAGDDLSANDVSVPDQPPQATDVQSGYFQYLWCLAGTNTYVFIDPIGNYGFNKGTNQPIFQTGLEGAINATLNAEKVQAAGTNNPSASSGDGWIDSQGTSLTFGIPIPANIAADSGIGKVQLFAQNANHQHLTWGIYNSALTILRDFVEAYPLYADAMYFQISDGKWSTVGNGYMGIVPTGTTQCYLKGSEAEGNGVACAMPSDYPNN